MMGVRLNVVKLSDLRRVTYKDVMQMGYSEAVAKLIMRDVREHYGITRVMNVHLKEFLKV